MPEERFSAGKSEYCNVKCEIKLLDNKINLTISDDGKGIPENIELRKLESLGLQLVNTLVDQLSGKIELRRTQGTEFKITFNAVEISLNHLN